MSLAEGDNENDSWAKRTSRIKAKKFLRTGKSEKRKIAIYRNFTLAIIPSRNESERETRLRWLKKSVQSQWLLTLRDLNIQVRQLFNRLSRALNIQCRENVRDLDTHLPDCNLFGETQIALTKVSYAKIEPNVTIIRKLKRHLRNIIIND